MDSVYSMTEPPPRTDTRQRKAHARCAAFLFAWALVGCASPGDERTQVTRSAIIGGAAVGDRLATVLIGGAGVCTGTLVAPNLVLTAKHCVAEVTPGSYSCDSRGNVVPTPGIVFDPPPGRYGALRPVEKFTIGSGGASPCAPHVARVLVASGANVCATDIAMLVLDRPMDDPTVAPIRLDRGPAILEPLSAVGWGFVETSKYPPGLRERRVNVVVVGPDDGVVASAGGRDPVPPGYFTTGEAVCHGDSGGPAFATSGAVVGVAHGVNQPYLTTANGTASDCAGVDARSVYVATARERDFILAAFDAAAARPWLEGTPDPRSTLAEVGATCEADGACRSNVCVAGPGGDRRCSHACLDGVCPAGSVCTTTSDRMRCVPSASSAAGPVAESPGGCAAARTQTEGLFGAATLVFLLWLSVSRRNAARQTRGARDAGYPTE